MFNFIHLVKDRTVDSIILTFCSNGIIIFMINTRKEIIYIKHHEPFVSTEMAKPQMTEPKTVYEHATHQREIT